MSFHFDPQPDSSDEDAPPLDISAWTTKGKQGDGSRPVSESRAPTAPMMSGALQDSSESDTVSATSNKRGRARREEAQSSENNIWAQQDSRASPVRLSMGFTSINQPQASTKINQTQASPVFNLAGRDQSLGLSDIMNDIDEVMANIPDSAPEKLVPIIPRVQIENDFEIEDFTQEIAVRRVVGETKDREGNTLYRVELWDGAVEKIPEDELDRYINGPESLEAFEETTGQSVRRKRRSKMSFSRPYTQLSRETGFVSTLDAVSDDELLSEKTPMRRRGARTRQNQPASEDEDVNDNSSGSDDDEAYLQSTSRGPARRSMRTRRSSEKRELVDELNEMLSEDESDTFMGFEPRGMKKRKRGRTTRGRQLDNFTDDEIDYETPPKRQAMRQSGRTTRHQGDMLEIDVNDIYRSESDSQNRPPPKPKATGAKEVFKQLPRNDDFRMRHVQHCDTCGQGTNSGPLICCQGCILAYHKNCLGHRTNRDHLVTKVGEEDFVLQCRRCVALPRKKEATAPDQGKCQDCREPGRACEPFRPRKTPMQEQKERAENDGVDPTYEIDPVRINNAENVLFRCLGCFRAFHFEHLPSLNDVLDMEVDADQRFREYSHNWKCKECTNMPAKVSGIIAWKPIDEDNYDPEWAYEAIDEDEKVYLLRWEGMSYFRASWMPGAWVWGVAAPGTRKSFAKKFPNPVMRTEDAIPEDYLRTDIVLDIKYTSIVDIRAEEVDKARIRETDKALIKYKGLGYEDAVWEAPPSPDDGERWTDFVTAYNDWVLGRYVRQPHRTALKARLEKARNEPFTKLEKKAQPDTLTGGELMKYQLEGVNWLYYKWHTQKNAILADEMGLGKTIQIIGFLATLVQDWTCFPFLVVVPNSTCPNWRREIKNWAPGLRVVAYYGSRESRDLAFKHELFPGGSRDLRCHVVVTSYDAAADENCRKFFRSVPWQGLIVDEGQRLKNDKNQLYAALGALKVPFKILLTGTPLQNNTRELFNLLHFLDSEHDAEKLEEEFQNLDHEKITKLHDMIRPFFLRRTKAQVLTFLPPMAQIIIPISMTVVQKRVYKSILSKNPDLMRSLFSTESSLKKDDGASLNNILMQLRKTLCHPFVYSRSIEERSNEALVSHRNLVEASGKLKLLEILLPKLKEKGHRVLIFSQFLDMLDIVEDFLDGCNLRFQRLDGQISSLQKQKRIDEFNAPDSELFAFLLSTRAGGVGINLATADTVIILDPDFNPHQDIQALSRAHRIGQKKKVLCFQLVTRLSAEERIMQIGRKKLALDHALIQNMDTDDATQTDLASILRYGASALFEDSGDTDIGYDGPAVDRLLDRSHMEDTQGDADRSAESQFSFARVWANDANALQDADVLLGATEEVAPDGNVWANILKERERIAAEEAAAKAEAFGRGQRARGKVDYAGDKILEGADGLDLSPIKNKKKSKDGSESDTDFMADNSDEDDEANASGEDPEHIDGKEIGDLNAEGVTKRKTGTSKSVAVFRRVTIPAPRPGQPINPSSSDPDHAPHPSSNVSPYFAAPNTMLCVACRTHHPAGSCPLKLAGVEHCNLCGMAHYGHSRVCPHIQSETQVRAMLAALSRSKEPEHLIAEARRYLRGLKGNLVQEKKKKAQKEKEKREMQMPQMAQMSYATQVPFQQPARPAW